MSFSKKDYEMMNIAKAVAAKSKDRSTKVGCLIVGKDDEPLSWGYNGFPRKVDDDKEERHERPLKYLWTEHSERNAIFSAARSGIKLLDSRMYVTSLIICPDCARAVIQAGVSTVYIEAVAFNLDNPRVQFWIDLWKVSREMFLEAGVTIIYENDENAKVS